MDQYLTLTLSISVVEYKSRSSLQLCKNISEMLCWNFVFSWKELFLQFWDNKNYTNSKTIFCVQKWAFFKKPLDPEQVPDPKLFENAESKSEYLMNTVWIRNPGKKSICSPVPLYCPCKGLPLFCSHLFPCSGLEIVWIKGRSALCL
jgi:hypothetical protein